MAERITRQIYRRILKNQPKVVLQRIDLSKIEDFGVVLNSVAVNITGISKKKKQEQQQQHQNEKLSRASTQTKKEPKSKAMAFITAPRHRIYRNVTNFAENKIILVKWPYYPDWPAIITAVQGKFVQVKFFGDKG